MTTLPSFVDLMASLGLDQESQKSSSPPPPSSPHSHSPTVSPRLTPGPLTGPARCRSHPSLREHSWQRISKTPRFSPYSPSSSRRGSLSSSSTLAPEEKPFSRALSTSPRLEPSLRMRRQHQRGLTVNVCDSGCGSVAGTPISSYVRRKTPAASPTCSDFSLVDNLSESSLDSPTPFSLTLPTLPPFFSGSQCGSLPTTPESDHYLVPSDSTTTPVDRIRKVRDFLDVDSSTRRGHTGIRLSVPIQTIEKGKISGQV